MNRFQLGLFVQGLGFASHACIGYWVASITTPLWGATVAVVLLALSAWRVNSAWHDRRRSRWVTRWVDEPSFVHWVGAVLALPLGLGFLVLDQLVTAPPVTLRSYPGAYAFGALVAAWGVYKTREAVEITRIVIDSPRTPQSLDGYRIAHLSDLHIGSFHRRERGLGWVRLANQAQPDLAVVTGDLVTSGPWFYDEVAAVIGELRARDGVLVSLGNHDLWDSRGLVAKLEERGARVLRDDSWVIERQGSRLVMVGLDPRTRGAAMDDVLDSRPAGFTVLLSHYPDRFEQAAGRGVELTLSGHTHGGQLGVPLVARWLNVARLTGQRGRGLWKIGDSALFVSAGLGTTGPPMRLGIPPELPLVELRARRDASL